MPENKVILVAEKGISEARLKMGWHKPDFGCAEVIISPDIPTIEKFIHRDTERTVHIFSGTRGYPMVWFAFQRCISTRAKIGIMSESGNWLGIKGKLRLLRSRIDAFRFQHRVDFILAIGHLGVRWYKQSGYPEHKIYPFGYFTERPSGFESKDRKQAEYSILFIGQNFIGKGLDKLLYALSQLNLRWSLKIIGNYKDSKKFYQLCKELHIFNKIKFLGFMNNREAMEILNGSDLLVLPSKQKDGWGAVVNEALMRGIPVICSDYCGAADLLRNSERGEIVKAGSVESLKNALERWIKRGLLSSDERQRIRDWSNCISGLSAANYLSDIITHVYMDAKRPAVPWF